MTHLAMWDAPADGPETEWGALITTPSTWLGAKGRHAVTAWKADELARIGRAHRTTDHVAPRGDGSLRP